MIFYAPNGQAAEPAVTMAVHEHAFYGRTFQAQAGEGPVVETEGAVEPGDSFEPKPPLLDLAEDYDWSDPHLRRHFIHLEQKVLAKKASHEEFLGYQAMKRDRNGIIFAERQMRDYAEVQRLKKLSAKLEEIQHYLRPIEI